MIKIKRENFPYRQAVHAVIIDNNNQFLVVQKVNYKDNEWSFVGGGIEENENPREAILREIKEELGLINIEILAESKAAYKYDWPEEVIIKQFHKLGKYFGGQQFKYFLIKYSGDKSTLKFQKAEIKAIKWISYDQLSQHLIFPNQWEDAVEVIKEFDLSF